MNGIHDMGGMHGFGPIAPESAEPVFHQVWEGRVFALRRAMGAWRLWAIDASRHAVERVPAADYLRMSYYERQLAAFIDMLVQHRLITRAELAAAKPAPGSAVAIPAMNAAQAAALIAAGVPASRALPVMPNYRVGERVRARNLHPPGHTREPRYVRGRTGRIERDHGVFVFADTNAHGQGERPQHLYSVRFGAQELWGPAAAARDAVYVDLWDAHLEPA